VSTALLSAGESFDALDPMAPRRLHHLILCRRALSHAVQ
jgi:hypothetical protein